MLILWYGKCYHCVVHLFFELRAWRSVRSMEILFKIRVHEGNWSVTIFGAFTFFMQFSNEWNDPYNLTPNFWDFAEKFRKSKVLKLENGSVVRWRFPIEFIEVTHVFIVTYLWIWTPARPWTRSISHACADFKNLLMLCSTLPSYTAV